MKFKITHETIYTFDSEVFLEPHFFRFQPRETDFLKVIDFSLKVQPNVEGQKNIVDEESNRIHFYWFNGLTKTLKIEAKSNLLLLPYNPFDFLIYPGKFGTLPFEYSDLHKKLLHSTLETQPISENLLDFGRKLLKEANYKTIKFLIKLTEQIHKNFDLIYREIGSPLEPNETFLNKNGSCRDITWMQINLLRNLGIAARFVSGYFYFEMDEPSYELHAWVEVFLPGVGWFGLDPSHGIFTGNTHFPIASSAHFTHTMPVTGGIRGSASSILKTHLKIEKI